MCAAITGSSCLIHLDIVCNKDDIESFAKVLQLHPTIAQVDLCVRDFTTGDLEQDSTQLSATFNSMLDSNTSIVEFNLEGNCFTELVPLTVRNQRILLENAPHVSGLPSLLNIASQSAVFAFLRRNSNRVFENVLEGGPPMKRQRRLLHGSRQ